MNLQVGEGNNQQKIKSQIQLLKQKYLKKNNQHKIEEIKDQPHLQTKIQQHDNNSIKQITQKNKQVKLKESSQSYISIQNKQHINSSGWSMKKFIEQQDNEQKQSLKQNKKNQEKEFYEEKINVNDPFKLKVAFQYHPTSESSSNNLKDAQYQEIQGKENQEFGKCNRRVQKIAERSLSEACKIWQQSPRKALIYLIFSEGFREDQIHKLELTSQNPSFPGIVKSFAEQFIFNNEQILKESQKQVVYNMALQYFSPSPKYLSNVLVVCLIKMAPLYATVYADQIIRKMPYYMQKIVQFRKYLLKEQLQTFIKVIEERIEILRGEGYNCPIESLVWMLVVKPSSSYCHEILLTKNIQSQVHLFTLFCVLYPDGKQMPLSILYLKCVDALLMLFMKSGIIEKVIRHLNDIKIPEVLYKPVKSLKLKLIKTADVSHQKKKGEEQKGFTNFINDKINILKEALENKTKFKSKAQVFYNTQTGQYEPISSNPTKSFH